MRWKKNFSSDKKDFNWQNHNDYRIINWWLEVLAKHFEI